MILAPAYGRICTSRQQILNDFNQGKDFRCLDAHFVPGYVGGPYIDRDGVLSLGQGHHIEFRYGADLGKVTTHNATRAEVTNDG